MSTVLQTVHFTPNTSQFIFVLCFFALFCFLTAVILYPVKLHLLDVVCRAQHKPVTPSPIAHIGSETRRRRNELIRQNKPEEYCYVDSNCLNLPPFQTPLLSLMI